MRYSCILLVALLALTACDEHLDEDKASVVGEVKDDAHQLKKNTQEDTENFAGHIHDSLIAGTTRVRDWWLKRPAPPQPRSIASSYCYHVLQDVLCYRQPLPGAEYRLVGYQGTGAEPPPPAFTQPLPLRENTDTSQSPANRVANAQPVFVEPPKPIKEEPKDKEEMPIMDSAHQQLPNPALAPQL